MSLFVCDRCGVVENTALSLYWLRSERIDPELKGQALCSECDPQLTKGWHGLFPREQWDGQRDVLNRDSTDKAGSSAPTGTPPPTG